MAPDERFENVGALHPGHPAPPTGTVARAPVATVPTLLRARRIRQLRAERAPRLRRIAALIDERAPRSDSPQAARALACRMRLRASEIEAGIALTDDGDAMRLLSETPGDAGE